MNGISAQARGRLHYLDWLRVLAFGLLVFYHTGLIFVDWGYHIQNDVFSESFKLPMLFVNQWRLPLIFFISGAGVKFALGRKNGPSFFKERFIRLFIPLVFGILVVIPPQVYFERLSQQEFNGSYFSFYPEFYVGVYPTGNFTWNHLWFLSYLITYIIITFPLLIFLRGSGRWLIKKLIHLFSIRLILLMFVIPLVITEFFLRDNWPDTRNLISDWYNFSFYMIIFIYGYFIAAAEILWDKIEKDKWIYFVVGCLSFMIIYFGNHQEGENFLEYTALGKSTFKFLKCLNTLVWIFFAVGFAKTHLNFSNEFLLYTNKAVYPFYVLHQTVLITIGYYLLTITAGILTKYFLIVVGTYFITMIIYDLVIRRVWLMKVFFGVK